MAEHRHRVLLVDDHTETREALAAFLDSEDFDVHAVATGTEGLALLRRSASYCFVVLDWRLPDMSGKDFLPAKRRDPSLADISVLVLSGDHHARHEAIVAGADHFLLKPCEPEVLATLVRNHCPSRSVTQARPMGARRAVSRPGRRRR